MSIPVNLKGETAVKSVRIGGKLRRMRQERHLICGIHTRILREALVWITFVLSYCAFLCRDGLKLCHDLGR